MSESQDEFFKEPEIIEEKQPSRPRYKKRPGGFLNLLSGILVSGTVVVGLLFAIIFINPQSSLNPLPPTTMPAPFSTYTPSSTPKPVFPPTWTPTISPMDTPTSTPIPTDTPKSKVENSPPLLLIWRVVLLLISRMAHPPLRLIRSIPMPDATGCGLKVRFTIWTVFLSTLSWHRY